MITPEQDPLKSSLHAAWPEATPRPGLLADILESIARYEQKTFFRRALLLVGGFVVSVVSFAGIIWRLVAELSQTGALDFAVTFFSDLTVTASHWSEFAGSIFESLPIFTIVLGLVSFGAALLFGKASTMYTQAWRHASHSSRA